MDWRTVLFGWPPRSKPTSSDAPATDAPADDAASPASGEENVYAKIPETELRASQQHRWLFDDGVLHWNQHRRDKNFTPKFAGLNFVKESAKTRLWGRPADIVGDERVVLTGIDWAFADLQGATLARADLRNARLVAADLRNANLAGALLNGADLTDCDLRGANLDGAQFARAQLARANMSGASMKGANFAWSNLTHAVVGAKNLAEANVFGAIRDGLAVELHAPRPQAAE
jgi:uncharacterized protein YjbI with pentapeptide repeats